MTAHDTTSGAAPVAPRGPSLDWLHNHAGETWTPERDHPTPAIPEDSPQNTGTYWLLETSTGSFLDYDKPRAKTIGLRDVAVGLGRTVRFRGQGGRFYSVAEHAVLVADVLLARGSTPAYALAGLHHDDHEAFMGDCPTPLKKLINSLSNQAWSAIESALDEAIVPALNLPFEPRLLHDDGIKRIDRWATLFEAGRLLPSGGRGWLIETDLPMELPDGVVFVGGLPEERATELWLHRHRQLSARAWLDAHPF